MQHRLIAHYVELFSLVILAAGAQVASAAGPGLHGRVLGLDEEGRYVGVVAGAAIEFHGQGGGSAAQTTSEENGYYRGDLPAGVYTYKITADGYRTEDEGRGLEIRQSEGYVVQDFSLVRGQSESDEEPAKPEPTPVGLLDGRVLELNEQGQRIGGVPDARITLRRMGATELRHVVARGGDPQSEDSGKYAVELPAGEWRASVSATGFDTLVFPEMIPISDGETTTRDFELRRTTQVTRTLQGIKGLVVLPPETPRTAIRVRIESLLRPQTMLPSLKPDDTGRFIRELPAGNYRVTAEAEGFYPGSQMPVTVFDGRYTSVVLRLAPLVTPAPVEPAPTPEPLKLVVTVQERTSEGLLPIAGARVLLRREGDALSQADRSSTDAKGTTSFNVENAGNFAVLAQAKEFKPGGLKLHVGPGASNRADLILLRATPDVQEQLVTVSGSVMFRDPQNPKLLHVLPRTRMIWRDAQQAQPVQSADSDEQGAFSVQLPAGGYVVELQPPAGFRGDKVELAVSAKMAARTFILEPQTGPDATPPVEPQGDVQVAGVVVGSPISQARRYVPIPDAALTWKGARAQKSTRSDRAGRFSLMLPPGLYTVRGRANGYDALEETVVVQPGMDSVRLNMARTAEPGPGVGELVTLNIRVMQRTAAAVPLRRPYRLPGGTSPLAGAEISILQKGQRVAAGQSDRAGRYSVELRPGSYDIRVTRTGFVPGQASVVLTTAPQSREIVLTRAALPDEQPPPPQGQQTLTLRVVEQTVSTVGPGSATTEQTQYGDERSASPTQTPEGRKPGLQDSSKTKLRQQPDARRSALEQLQQRSRRKIPRGGSSAELPRPTTVNPIAGAAIVVRSGANVVAQGTADRNGIYRVQLAPGSYDVKVSAQGFVPALQSVRIGNNDVTRQVVLRRAAVAQ